jgi:hypothetical protein
MQSTTELNLHSLRHFGVPGFLALAVLCPLSIPAQSTPPSKFAASLLPAGIDRKATHEIIELASAQSQSRRAAPFIEDSLRASVPGGSPQFIIVAREGSKHLETQARNAGFEVVGTYSLPGGTQHTVVRGTNAASLLELAGRPDVIFVTQEPPRRRRAGSVAGQGDAGLRANLARTNYGINGAGIRVGVISDSISRTPAVGGTVSGGFLAGSNPQNSGDLPSSIRVLNNGTVFDSDEGAAMLEIVHDIAPGSPLSFADAASYSGFAANITSLRTDPGLACKVIVDDIGYFAEPTYQAGHIEVAGNLCLANNVLFFSAYGNDGIDAHERPFTDPNPATDSANPPSGVNLHDFGVAAGQPTDKFLTFAVPNGAGLTVILRWDEPGNGTFAQGSGATSDLDLYLLNSTDMPFTISTIRAQSLNVQGTPSTPSGSPYEVAFFNNNTGSNQTVQVAVNHFAGRVPERIHLQLFPTGAVTFNDRNLIQDSASWGHPNGEQVVGVAASFYGEIDSNGAVDAPSGVINVESFSSRGGNIPRLIGDNGVRLVSAVTRAKPDLTAPDGVNTTFFANDIGFDADAFPNFFGTSAAAPHAAAAAALVWSARPSLTANEVLTALRTTARDIESAGYDFLAGSGLIDTNAAVQSILVAGAQDWSLFE